MPDTPHPSATPQGRGESRRNPRFEVSARIQGRMFVLDEPVTLLDMSVDGFQMEARFHFPLGTVESFRFSATDREAVLLRARIVHAKEATSGDAVSYVVGLEFLDRGATAVEESLAQLVSSIAVAA